MDTSDRKIIVSGDATYGLGEKIRERYPTARFFSRKNNECDFDQPENINRFVEESLNSDVYISCSSLYNFKQTLLLEKVYNRWVEAGHKGRIIVLGSTADVVMRATPWLYPSEKKALRAYCRGLSLAVLGGHGKPSQDIRLTYISPGHLDTPKANEKHPDVDKIDCGYLVELIDWVLRQPMSVNISELCVDPVQTGPVHS